MNLSISNYDLKILLDCDFEIQSITFKDDNKISKNDVLDI